MARILKASTRDRRDLNAYFAAHGYPPVHPLALLFRSDQEVGQRIQTADDVLLPVLVRKHTGEIVDGVTRCQRLCAKGVSWSHVRKKEIDLPTDEAVAEFIATCNLDRRHLNQSQKALLLVRLGLAKSNQGARTDLGKNFPKFGVSSKYLRYARFVANPNVGSPELLAAVSDDEISVADAAKIAEFLSVERQAKLYAETRNGIPTFKTAAANAVNEERNLRLSRSCARLPDLIVPVIYLDTPWPKVGESILKGRAAVAHYPVMTIDEIYALPIPRLAAEDSWLFAWTTGANRTHAEEMMGLWGFEIVEEIIWHKNRCGQGWIVRHAHETLLVGRKGKPPLPPTDAIPPSVITADVQDHSRKPNVFRDVIIAMTPNLTPRLELFARGPAYPGFLAWGNEVTSPAQIRRVA
jgi:N6-adenosine-specific RNA methylase IME4